LLDVRRQCLINEFVDPLRNGFELPIWEVADQWRAKKRKKYPKGVVTELNLGGNRSSKSERAAKRVVEACLMKPGSRWWCCDSTEAQSRMNQQRLIWKYLPAEWRNVETGSLRRTRVTKVKYSVAGGFTENCLIMPNESEIFFKFYEMNIKNLEGPELDGVWSDELIPLDWVETLVYRLTNRNGVHHITFTPKDGWTPTVGNFLDGAIDLELAEAELLPEYDQYGDFVGNEKVKRIQQPRDDKAIALYFFTQDNPFGNYEGMTMDLRGKSKNVILIRAYGNVNKAAYAQFPLFSDEVHVVSEARVREMMKRPEGSKAPPFEIVQLVDPCPGRNWFMLWAALFPNGKKLIFREWPSFGHAGAYVQGVGDPGPWAIAGDAHDGVRGEAQDGFGFGLARYKEEILEKEDGEEVRERWMDSRYGNAPQQEREGSKTLIEQMLELEMEFLAATSEKTILNTNDGSIDMINSLLYYDTRLKIGEFNPTTSRANEPQLLISELCPNTIYALKNWTGKDGQKGACKDPIDDLRMLVLSPIEFQGQEAYLWKR